MKTKMMTAVALTTALCAGHAADAAIVSMDYSGTVSHEGTAPVVATGSVARLVFSYDDAAPVARSIPGADFFGDYAVTATLYINGRQVPFQAIYPSTINMHYDNFRFASYASPDFTAIVYFGDSDGTTISAGALPTAAQLAAFTEASLSIYDEEGYDTFALSPTPAAAIPEPASWAMMVLGLGLVGAAARRRRPAARLA